MAFTKIKIKKYQLERERADMVRHLFEMKDVLYDKGWFKKSSDFPFYYVWRKIKERNNLRYDITLILPRMLGKEFPKTKGHCHINPCPELIEILEGKTFYFIQKGKGEKVEDCWVVEAKKGEFIIVPQNSQHLAINPTKKRLIMANWIDKRAQGDYSLFEKMQGACYYYTQKGWIKNKNYKTVPKLRFERGLKTPPSNLKFLLCKSKK